MILIYIYNFNNISLFCTSTWFLHICLHIVWILFQIMLPSWLLSRTLAVYWQVMWCAKLLKQMLALTHGTTLQRLPEEAASEQRKRPMSLFPLKWFCMVLLACGPAIVANCIKFRYPYIYIYTYTSMYYVFIFGYIQYLCNITYLYVFYLCRNHKRWLVVVCLQMQRSICQVLLLLAFFRPRTCLAA